jgi:hypothetical protein
MPSFVYDSAKLSKLDGSINLSTHSFKLMLLTDSHTPSKSGHTVKADVSGDEVSGGGYSAGGKAMTTGISRNGAVVSFDSDNILTLALGPDWRYAVVYDDSHANDALVALLDPGALQEPGGGDYVLAFDAEGVLTATDG